MRVVIAGGHGKIAQRLERLLAARGDGALALVRNPDHVSELNALGAEAVPADLEKVTVDELAALVGGADAVVFAAGAGPGSGTDRKDTVDRGAAALLAEAATAAGVRRYLLVSSTGVERADAPGVDEVFAAYLRAKAAAEDDLRQRDLDWTILRPGRLTDDPGTGRVALHAPPVERADVTRQDVAAVLLGLLDEPSTAGLTLELMGGETPIPAAISAVLTA